MLSLRKSHQNPPSSAFSEPEAEPSEKKSTGSFNKITGSLKKSKEKSNGMRIQFQQE